MNEQIEKYNRKRLLEECYTKEQGQLKPKTKTASIIEKLNNEEYKRTPCKELLTCTKQETKTIMIARFGMLECGKNFKSTMNKRCNPCNSLDDEDHRLNHCKKYRGINNFDSTQKDEFNLVYEDETESLKRIIPSLMRVWNTKNSYGSMIT